MIITRPRPFLDILNQSRIPEFVHLTLKGAEDKRITSPECGTLSLKSIPGFTRANQRWSRRCCRRRGCRRRRRMCRGRHRSLWVTGRKSGKSWKHSGPTSSRLLLWLLDKWPSSRKLELKRVRTELPPDPGVVSDLDRVKIQGLPFFGG